MTVMTGVKNHTPEVDNYINANLDAGRIVHPTHGRFALRRGRDFIISDSLHDPKLRERVLITPETGGEYDIYRELALIGLSQFEVLDATDESVIYRVPIQAKPLSYESLYGSKESTETYIGDIELVSKAARMWRDFNLTVGRFPSRKPLRNVGLIDFNATNVVPIPPYCAYDFTGVMGSTEKYTAMLTEELQRMGETESIPLLVDASRSAWRD